MFKAIYIVDKWDYNKKFVFLICSSSIWHDGRLGQVNYYNVC